MSYFNEHSSFKKALRYIFFVAITLWVIISAYIIYQYLRSSSKEITTKGGTFVEGIFETTSFLPYLRNDEKSLFYQGLLFKWCLTYSLDANGTITYKDSLCHVTTTDYRTYHLMLMSGNIWSDGVPLSLNDIYFTYHDIVYKNVFGLKLLEVYKNIEVVLEGAQVRVTFPSASPDNTFFFTNYILPQHALVNPSIEYYKQSFAIEPVYNNCAKIMSQTTDQYSLIFDLSNCEDTNLGFYQIKNMQSFENFKTSAQAWKQSMIDIYSYPEQLPWYVNKNLLTNKLVTIFFNTNSDNLRVRVRRAIWGMIKYNFENQENAGIEKYTETLFNYFLSKGTNVKEFIESLNETENNVLSKKDLIDAWVKELPNEISFSWTDQKYVFFSEKVGDNITLTLKFNEKYDKIAIKYNTGWEYVPSSYNKEKKSLQYILSKQQNNFTWGLNKYTIYATLKDKKNQVGSIDIYNLYTEQTTGEANKKTLTILSYDNPISKEVVQNLKKIFKKTEIQDYFQFIEINNTTDREVKLTAWEYDMVINTIDMGLKEDLTKLFSTNKPTINPSQYNDARFVSLLQQYSDSKDSKSIMKEINTIYANDMPFLILWKEYAPIQIKTDLVSKLFTSGTVWYEYNRRNNIYNNLSLTFNVRIDPNKAWSLNNFLNFIQTTLNR